MTSIARRVAIMQWSPRRLGSGLYAAWDPEERASLTLSGGAASTWADYVNGVAPTQALGSSRPAYGSSGFNGRPIVTPDGIDDQLAATGVPASIPTGATPFEAWVIWNQTKLVADAVIRIALGWGGGIGATAANFGIQRNVVSGVNRAQAFVGNGNSTIAVTNANVDFSGRHVLRAVVTGTSARIDVDDIAGAPAGVVPSIGSAIVRLFCSPVSAGAFAAGDFSGLFVTRPLSAGEVVNMYAYCNKRIV